MLELDIHLDPDRLIAPHGGEPVLEVLQRLSRQCARAQQPPTIAIFKACLFMIFLLGILAENSGVQSECPPF